MSELNSMAQRTRSFVLYYERPDAAKSNHRMMAHKLYLAGDRLLYIPGFCTAHALQRASEHTFREKLITGDIFSIQCAIQLPSHQARLIHKLREIVARDLVIVNGVRVKPAGILSVRTQEILQHTMGHSILQVRADATDGILHTNAEAVIRV